MSLALEFAFIYYYLWPYYNKTTSIALYMVTVPMTDLQHYAVRPQVYKFYESCTRFCLYILLCMALLYIGLQLNSIYFTSTPVLLRQDTLEKLFAMIVINQYVLRITPSSYAKTVWQGKENGLLVMSEHTVLSICKYQI